MFFFLGKATPVNFKSDSWGRHERSHQLEWVTESITPITNFKLQFKHENSANDQWTEVHVVPQNNGDHFYSGKFTVDKLSPATFYQARVSSKNNYGYSKFSQPFKFATKGAGKNRHSLNQIFDLFYNTFVATSTLICKGLVILSLTFWSLQDDLGQFLVIL